MTATTAGPAVLFRTSFVDFQISPIQLSSVQSSDGALRFIVPAHLHESKATRLSRIPIRDQIDTFNVPVLFKQRSNVGFGRAEAEISNKNIFHLAFFLNLQSS